MAIKLKVQENNVSFRINDNNSATFKAEQGIPIYPNAYQGDYTVTPLTEAQTLNTNGLMMTNDVEVEAVPRVRYVGVLSPMIMTEMELHEDGMVTVENEIAEEVVPVYQNGYATTEDKVFIWNQGGQGYQLPTQEAVTITPTSTEQIAVAKGKFTTGVIKVAPIPNNYGLITWNGSTLTVS